MSRPLSLLVCGLAAAALGGCGITAKPIAGTANIESHAGNHAKAISLVPPAVDCLRGAGFTVTQFETKDSLPAVHVGTSPSGPTLVFEPDPGGAEGLVIAGKAQGAELIGAVLLYPNGASDSEAKQVEQCAAIGVKG
jgi:hypothetical protein